MNSNGLSTVIWLPEMALIVLCSAWLWSKSVDATTIYSPTFQSTESETVKILCPGLMVAESRVQVFTLGVPYIENLHYIHPIPLFPNIGCCFP